MSGYKWYGLLATGLEGRLVGCCGPPLTGGAWRHPIRAIRILEIMQFLWGSAFTSLLLLFGTAELEAQEQRSCHLPNALWW